MFLNEWKWGDLSKQASGKERVALQLGMCATTQRVPAVYRSSGSGVGDGGDRILDSAQRQFVFFDNHLTCGDALHPSDELSSFVQ